MFFDFTKETKIINIYITYNVYVKSYFNKNNFETIK